MSSFDKYIKEMEKITAQAYKSDDVSNLKKDVAALAEKYDIESKKALDALRAYERRLKNSTLGDMVSKNDSPADPRVSKALRDPGFASFGGETNKDLSDLVKKARASNWSEKEFETRLQRAMKMPHYRAKTIARTIRMARIRANILNRAIDSGVDHFKIRGPLSARSHKWCIDHVGKIYSIEELLNMDNGQGLPVIICLGGYNCIHTIEPYHGEKVTDNFYIDNLWQKQFDDANKNDRKTLKKEMEFGKELSESGFTVEMPAPLNNSRAFEADGETFAKGSGAMSDAVVNGEQTEFKIMITNDIDADKIYDKIFQKRKGGGRRAPQDNVVFVSVNSINDAEIKKLKNKIENTLKKSQRLKVYIKVKNSNKVIRIV